MFSSYCGILLSLAIVSLSFPLARLQGRDVPDFVRTYAPVACLDSTEAYFPSDIGAQIAHSKPENGSGALITPPALLTLSNLDSLNAFRNSGVDIYLTSDEGINALPSWLRGTRPLANGMTPSIVASTIITASKANGILDAFYFYFYAYNQGDWVLGSPEIELGDHVGDWEHTMVRFVNGVPEAMWFSQHSDGEALYAATQKGPDGVRPVTYVANGTHANYAIPGAYNTIPVLNTVLPDLDLVVDHTDNGVFWDPLASAYLYDYDVASGIFSAYNGADPTAWLDFKGRWGDNQLPDSTPGQLDVFGQRKWATGPTGPYDKDLTRSAVCPDGKPCDILPALVPRPLETV